ncbi:response regulator transcription factor [Pusillimonas sp. CC-YST705]|uniref:Response regulator transcription factor n=1 Tax=Mesopusillimonas faecipullorum TaxID=2755040 RepID=A0ABS8CFD6_9BURK|nr:response regulator transcription factor [Mesopusillimonas faecipullorum]MCB5364760.1 response regulator transcription factor [Mesopusillimonas faecipullorum]
MTSTASDILPGPVLIIEDDLPMQTRLRHILLSLGYPDEALISAHSVAQALSCINEHPAAMALVDIGLPDGSGLALIDTLRANDPTLIILVISAWSTEDIILAALRAGATGYVLKERDDMEISLSIRSVLRGGAPIDPFIARRILELLPAQQPAAQAPPALGDPGAEALSPRETQILTLVADGLTNREIAESLHISQYTAASHIKNIYRKLSVSSRTKAIHEARARGLLY